MTTYTLFDLQEYIRRVLALNFSEALWITAEIAQCDQARGHFFIDLVQNGTMAGSGVLAQAQAVLWQRDYQRLRLALGRAFDELLQEGCEVRLQVRVDYHERYGLKLVIEEADPAYTFGRLELQRRETLESLRTAGLLEKNRALPLPAVLQRIAVISSEGAAGFQDFRAQLAQNAFGYRFECRFFSSAVQGDRQEAEMRAALTAVAAQAGGFNCAVILRGGGARLDLAGFDSLELCRQAAELPIPLFTGIGHEVDETVLDRVAHTALKTPTAVAEFLVRHNMFFENEILNLGRQIHHTVHQRLAVENQTLGSLESAAAWSLRSRLHMADRQLQATAAALPMVVRGRLQRASDALDQAGALCLALDPGAVLRRGFSITRKGGVVVRGTADLRAGDLLETEFSDGRVVSELV